MKRPFQPGAVVATRAAIETFTQEEILASIRRHASGDWGDVGLEDRKANEAALRDGSRLFSVYRFPDGRKLWIITEADRSSTCVLLPEDY
jgi:hypothetical protein